MNIASADACAHCDLLVDVPTLAAGERARCPRCRAPLCVHRPQGHLVGVCFALAGLVWLSAALSFMFLGFERAGQGGTIRLVDSCVALMTSGHGLLGGLLLLVVVILPMVLLLLLLALHGAIWLGWRGPGLPLLARVVHEVEQWNMVEVFVVGVLVSLTKLVALANVSYGWSFWSYLAFAVCLVIAANAVDRHSLWHTIRAQRHGTRHG